MPPSKPPKLPRRRPAHVAVPALPEPDRIPHEITRRWRARAMLRAYDFVDRPFFERAAQKAVMEEYIGTLPIPNRSKVLVKLLDDVRLDVEYMDVVYARKRSPPMPAKEYFNFYLKYVAAMESYYKMHPISISRESLAHIHRALAHVRGVVKKNGSFQITSQNVHDYVSSVRNALSSVLPQSVYSEYMSVHKQVQAAVFDVSKKLASPSTLS